MKKTEFKHCQASFNLLDVTTIVKIRNKNVRRHINNYGACSSLLIVYHFEIGLYFISYTMNSR
jgi:hypothetical protein